MLLIRWIEGDFVAAGELSAGERLATLAGPTAVLGIQPQQTRTQQTPQTVYNLEVQGQHVFRVTSNGLLVHNSYADDIAKQAGKHVAPKSGPANVRVTTGSSGELQSAFAKIEPGNIWSGHGN